MENKEFFAAIGEKFIERFGGNSLEAAKFLKGEGNTLGGDPFHTRIGPGFLLMGRIGDSESDLLAKLYNLMSKDLDRLKKLRKQELKYQKQLVKIKERRIAELIAALGGEKGAVGAGPMAKPKSKLGMIGLGVAGLLFSPDVMAMVGGFTSQFDRLTKNVDEIGKDLKVDIITPSPVIPTAKGIGPSESTDFDELFQKIGKEEGIDPALLKSVAKQESAFQPGAISRKGAMGLMQITPDTANRYNVPFGKEYDPETNIRVGAKFLKDLEKQYGGDVKLMLAAYNAGPGKVKKYGNQIPPFKETKEFVEKVLGYYKPTQTETPLSTETPGEIELQTITSKSGVSTQVNKKYAPNFQGFINDLESTGYQVKSLSGYNDRPNVNNPKVKSYHALGASIDINATENPNESIRSDLPPETRQLAKKWGLGWGMDWRSVKDPMHFSMAKEEGGSLDIIRPPSNVPMRVAGIDRTVNIPRVEPSIRQTQGQGTVFVNNTTFIDDSIVTQFLIEPDRLPAILE